MVYLCERVRACVRACMHYVCLDYLCIFVPTLYMSALCMHAYVHVCASNCVFKYVCAYKRACMCARRSDVTFYLFDALQRTLSQ